jgi:capsular exopolysaccharide synthesis family protein
MGKIHKALEKSKREHQGRSKPVSSSVLGAQKPAKAITEKNKREPKLDPPITAPESPEGDLASIHKLLDDSAKTVAPEMDDKDDLGRTKTGKISIPNLNRQPSVSVTHGGPPDKIKQDFEETHFVGTERILADSAEKGQESANSRVMKKNEFVRDDEIDNSVAVETNEKKIFLLKDKAPIESLQETPAEKPTKEYVSEKQFVTSDTKPREYGLVNDSLLALLKPRSYEAEQFKILRTNLLFPESGKPARSILITSAAPGDGKSFVSSNLAVSLALDQERKVLLIDADVRRSELHKTFGLNRVEKGICDYLADQIPLPSLLVATSLKNLLILPAGMLTRDPHEVQSLERLPKLFEELATYYSDYYVVIDSAPPKLASETGVLARLVDSIVIVMKAGVTKREFVEETIDLLGKAKIAGIVFNWQDNRMSKYKKYAQNGKYYHQ